MSDTVVRDATPGDAESIARFNAAMAHETEAKELDPSTVAAGVKAVFECPERGFYLVAEVDGRVAGALMVTKEWSDWRNAEYWWIQSVYVEANFRRRGIYSALYAEIKRRAQSRPDICGCRLYVERNNATAQVTYQKQGMQETPYIVYEQMLA